METDIRVSFRYGLDMPTMTKRERTRRLLLEAGRELMAERGTAITASDVVAAAEVSNGTFYNHFVDLDEFVQEVARRTFHAIAEVAAVETAGADPAWRFAVASTRILDAAVQDPTWGRLLLQLARSDLSRRAELERLRADLRAGRRAGRFVYGDDRITVDVVSGTIIATIGRLVRDDVGRRHIVDVVSRLLTVLGLPDDEARSVASAALRDVRAGARPTVAAGSDA